MHEKYITSVISNISNGHFSYANIEWHLHKSSSNFLVTRYCWWYVVPYHNASGIFLITVHDSYLILSSNEQVLWKMMLKRAKYRMWNGCSFEMYYFRNVTSFILSNCLPIIVWNIENRQYPKRSKLLMYLCLSIWERFKQAMQQQMSFIILYRLSIIEWHPDLSWKTIAMNVKMLSKSRPTWLFVSNSNYSTTSNRRIQFKLWNVHKRNVDIVRSSSFSFDALKYAQKLEMAQGCDTENWSLLQILLNFPSSIRLQSLQNGYSHRKDRLCW